MQASPVQTDAGDSEETQEEPSFQQPSYTVNMPASGRSPHVSCLAELSAEQGKAAHALIQGAGIRPRQRRDSPKPTAGCASQQPSATPVVAFQPSSSPLPALWPTSPNTRVRCDLHRHPAAPPMPPALRPARQHAADFQFVKLQASTGGGRPSDQQACSRCLCASRRASPLPHRASRRTS